MKKIFKHGAKVVAIAALICSMLPAYAAGPEIKTGASTTETIESSTSGSISYVNKGGKKVTVSAADITNMAAAINYNSSRVASLEGGMASYQTKQTTLAGYGITDAKIVGGTITLGTQSITPLTSASTLDVTKLTGSIPAGCYTDNDTTYVFDGTYNASTNKAATMSSITTAINPIKNNYLSTVSETVDGDGALSVTITSSYTAGAGD